MTTEEAIERIKSRYDKWALDDKDLEAIQYLFPELSESKDERIRKWIIAEIKATHDYDSPTSAKCVDDALAYLEKQKEQQPAEWSEEDVEKLAKKRASKSGTLKSEMIFYRQGVRDAFNYKGMRPSWKPSEEQIYSLGTVVKGIDHVSVGSVGYNLKELYEQLKKL